MKDDHVEIPRWLLDQAMNALESEDRSVRRRAFEAVADYFYLPGDVPLGCADCGATYTEFPLDMTLPDAQWLLINRQYGGVLCASCIVRRAGKLPKAVAVRARIEFAQDDDGVAETQRYHSVNCREQEAQRTREAEALRAGYELGKPSPLVQSGDSSDKAVLKQESVAPLVRSGDPLQALVWQPIETAPKDEFCTVLGHIAISAETRTMHWDPHEGWIKDSSYAMRTHTWKPTHWMPLPPPPAAEQERR